MKKLVGLLAVIFLVFGGGISAAQNEPLIGIEHITLLPMNGDEIIEDATVLIQGDRIVSIFTGIRVFDDYIEMINGRGKYLIPGLAEMHGHIPSATTYNQNLRDLLFLYLSNGVTTVRGMLGNAGQLKLQQDILDGEILGPTLYLGSPSFNGNTVSSALQARKKVRDHLKEGWDFLKIHPGLTLNEYNAMAEEATKQGITWGGHVPADVGLWRALEAGQVTIDHIDGYEEFTGTTLGGQIQPPDQILLDEAIQLTLESGAGVVPTNALWEVLLGGLTLDELEARDELKYVGAAERRSWRNRHQSNAPSPEAQIVIDQTIKNRRQILKALYDGGVPILLGSDAPQLFSVPG
ncbi:MAG: amidohydrolase family protein, partial [Alphaproteobacteria bacterium]